MASDLSAQSSGIIDVSAGLVFRGGQLLITQRQAGSHLGGLWEFPGGKREPHETFEECLHRELEEELGIAVAILGLLEQVIHHYPVKSVRLNFFHCRWRQHEPQAMGCHDFRWITSAELPLYPFPPADAQLLERLQSSPNLWTV